MNFEENFSKLFTTFAKSKELISTFSEIGFIKEFSSNTVILKENSYVKVIPLVLYGLIKVYKEEENGNEVLLYYIKPGESCIMSIMASEKNEKISVKGVVEEDSQLLIIPVEKLRLLRRKFPQWNLFVYQLFNEKFDEVIEMVKILTFSNKEKRLEDYLKKESQIKNTQIIRYSHQEIAQELGSSREVISRLLKKLENEGKVVLAQRQIKLLF
ncbi:MAG: Crp/Fnr family transcriptional regulator [Flavobacteriales bacterium]